MKNVNSIATVLIDSQLGLSCKAEPAISGLAAFQLLSDPWGLLLEGYCNLQPGEGKGHSLPANPETTRGEVFKKVYPKP